MEGFTNRKRPAEGTPPPRDELQNSTIEQRFEESRESIQQAASPGRPSPLELISPNLSSKPTEAQAKPTPPFPYVDIPIGANKTRFALAVHDDDAFDIIGGIDANVIDLALELRIDAGRLGFPHLKLTLHVANPLTGKPFSKEQPTKQQQHTSKQQRPNYETVVFQWYPATLGVDGKVMIEKFDFQPFSSWFASVDEQWQTLPSIQAMSISTGIESVYVITCNLRSAIFSGPSQPAIWQNLRATVRRRLEALRGEVTVTFITRAGADIRERHLPLFRRRVTEQLGIYSQYGDTTTGNYTLDRIEDAERIEDIGGGMYVNNDGTFRQLPAQHKFINIRHFKIATALGPIRMAQHTNPLYEREHFQIQLKAVNDFCSSTESAVVNFRNLLIFGGKSNPQLTSLNPYGTSLTDPAFLSVREKLTKILDSSQIEFVNKLAAVEEGILALTGPAGSGKSYLLCLVIWILFFLDHKVLICGIDQSFVQDLMLQLTSSQPDWVSDKNLLHLVQPEDITNAQGFGPPLDGLFLTLQHAGSTQLRHLDFEPSVIIVCQASKASLPSVCIPVTCFHSWETLLLVGDQHLSRPRIPKGTKTEAADYMARSPINILEQHQSNIFALRYQWRMSKTMALFPSKQFYGGKLDYFQFDPSDETRLKMHSTSAKHYRIRPPVGCDYFVLDVPNTQARLEEDEDSLCNYGNAAAIRELVANFNKEGIPSDDIVVLCFYKSQVNVLSGKVKASDDGTQGCREVRTVDSFHGRQAKVVIVDFVVADSVTNFVPGGFIKGIHYTGPSEFVRDPHRINLALTRAQCGLVVVGQIAQFVARGYGGAIGNTLYWLVTDAMSRKLVYSAEHIVDDHPRAIYSREVASLMADDTEQDLALTMKNYHAFVKEKLARKRPERWTDTQMPGRS
ncbi:MAG: hypothetical protein Q9168_002672 [Polycauliona sp. 1 TL-2023]